MSAGRGRPPVLTAPLRALLLAELRGGATVSSGAALVGVARDTVYATRNADAGFDRAVTAACQEGRRARRSGPHEGSEYRYVHYRCRCPSCTGAATAARARRREAAAHHPTATITALPTTTPAPDRADAA